MCLGSPSAPVGEAGLEPAYTAFETAALPIGLLARMNIPVPQGKRHLRKRRPYNALARSEALAFVLSLRNRNISIIQLFLLNTSWCAARDLNPQLPH